MNGVNIINPSLQYLYQSVNEEVAFSHPHREKMLALATARQTLQDRLDERCDNDTRALIEACTLLDDERQTIHERALFERAFLPGDGAGTAPRPVERRC